MAKTGPILLIEDDPDDQELTQEAIRVAGAKNEVKIFSSCEQCYHYMLHMGKTQPFIILSDVNLPKETGIEFKERIEKNPRLKNKSIPFVFFSTAADHPTVVAAYECRIQGYFVKGSTMKELAETLKLVFSYWQQCKHPNN